MRAIHPEKVVDNHNFTVIVVFTLPVLVGLSQPWRRNANLNPKDKTR